MASAPSPSLLPSPSHPIPSHPQATGSWLLMGISHSAERPGAIEDKAQAPLKPVGEAALAVEELKTRLEPPGWDKAL